MCFAFPVSNVYNNVVVNTFLLQQAIHEKHYSKFHQLCALRTYFCSRNIVRHCVWIYHMGLYFQCLCIDCYREGNIKGSKEKSFCKNKCFVSVWSRRGRKTIHNRVQLSVWLVTSQRAQITRAIGLCVHLPNIKTSL